MKKKLALLLACSMALSLTACGGGSNHGSSFGGCKGREQGGSGRNHSS